MRIFITGSKGQLGSDIYRVFNNHETFVADLDTCDISNYQLASSVINEFSPDILINCAAFTNVDECEIKKNIAQLANEKGAENLAKISKNINCLLIHISTDYVFDGQKRLPDYYKENDEAYPVSYYGQTKLNGEKAIILNNNNYIILRTSWLFGISGKKNFLKTILRLSLNNPLKEIKIVNDQYGSPTWSWRLALQVKKLIDSKSNGLYHATAEGYCTWYELAKYFMEKMNIPHKIIPCKTSEYKTIAKRPKNSILENSRLKDENINIMEFWKNDIKQFVSIYRDQLQYSLYEI